MYARPTTSCAQLIKLYGLHYRSTEDGFEVYKQIRSSPHINKTPDTDLEKCFLDQSNLRGTRHLLR